MTPDWEREAKDAEQRFRDIHQKCKGRPIKSLLAMPAALRATRDIFVASYKGAYQRRNNER